MDVDALVATLDRLEREGRQVMAVVATAGSTATGSFDDLEAIAELCGARGIWLHVDAAHGASALLSARPPRALNGLRHARTLAWDPHKGMLLPLAAGMVLARQERDLDGAFAQQAPYLFSAPGKAGDEGARKARVLDQGVRSFQCSRRADVLKVWFAIQRYGSVGLGQVYDHLCRTARLLHDAIEEHPEFENLHEPESNILCFRYVGPPPTRARDHIGSDTARIDAINRELRPRYNRGGTGWITATILAGRPVLRVTMMNLRTGPAHVRALLDGLVMEARKIEAGGAR